MNSLVIKWSAFLWAVSCWEQLLGIQLVEELTVKPWVHCCLDQMSVSNLSERDLVLALEKTYLAISWDLTWLDRLLGSKLSDHDLVCLLVLKLTAISRVKKSLDEEMEISLAYLLLEISRVKMSLDQQLLAYCYLGNLLVYLLVNLRFFHFAFW